MNTKRKIQIVYIVFSLFLIIRLLARPYTAAIKNKIPDKFISYVKTELNEINNHNKFYKNFKKSVYKIHLKKK
jgi:hypothetical protein